MTTLTEPKQRPPTIIATERLLLRKPRIEDAEAIFDSYATDEDVTRYLTWTIHENLDETCRILARFIRAWDNDERFEFVIENRASRQLMGMIGIGSNESKGEIGYVLAKRYWNRGYMTEAVKALANWGLRQGGIQRIHAYCDKNNEASARVLEKSGLYFEGILRRWSRHPQIDPHHNRDCKMFSRIGV